MTDFGVEVDRYLLQRCQHECGHLFIALHFGYRIHEFQISTVDSENWLKADPILPEFSDDIAFWPVQRIREAQIQVMGGPAASRLMAPGTDDGLGGFSLKYSDCWHFGNLVKCAEAANSPSDSFFPLTDEGIQAAQHILRQEPFWAALQPDGFFQYVLDRGRRVESAWVLSGQDCEAYFKKQQ